MELQHFQPPPQYLRDEVIRHIDSLLHSHGRTLDNYNLPHPLHTADIVVGNRLICEQLNYDVCLQQRTADEIYATLNREQSEAYKCIMGSVEHGLGRFFFLYGHGGTGKTYLYNTIIAKLRSQHKIALVVASSGIAATLLPDGSTGHSRFKIPIDVDASSTCKVKKGTHLAELLQQTSLIVWDEAPMTHRFCFEALSKTLCDVMDLPSTGTSYRPFGGKTVFLVGIFVRFYQSYLAAAARKPSMHQSYVRPCGLIATFCVCRKICA
ncbi:unnamed protein product [Linum tenue]|uniref:ATP-dependent DNA helicase n=1 Tax=Linum tenue TaxID=586396 RepID=A0AAV0L8M0_9ROSI|nr:unnamed protein product [Linum tenue]